MPYQTRAAPAQLDSIIRFLFVGGTGAVAFILISSAMIDLRTGLPDWVVSALTWAALIGPVYLGHRLISFRTNAPHAQALPRYVAVQVCGLLLAALLSFLAYSVFGFRSIVGAVFVAGLTAAINFVVLKAWAFAAS